MQAKITKTIAVSINSTPITPQEVPDKTNLQIVRELFPEKTEVNDKQSVGVNTTESIRPEIKPNLADSAVLVAEIDHDYTMKYSHKNYHNPQEDDSMKTGLKFVIGLLIVISTLDLAFEIKKNGMTPVLLAKIKELKIILQKSAVFVKKLPHLVSTEILPRLIKEFKNLPQTLKLAIINTLRSN